jgi:hypothetical protein
MNSSLEMTGSDLRTAMYAATARRDIGMHSASRDHVYVLAIYTEMIRIRYARRLHCSARRQIA